MLTGSGVYLRAFSLLERRLGHYIPLMEPKSIALTKQYLGKQEMFGSNEGPVIGVMKAFLGINAKGVSWCGIFVGWILCRAYSLKDKSALRVALGFDSPFFVDSTKDWLAQAKAHKMITTTPAAGDLFILLDGHGQAHHIGFVVSEPDEDGRFRTVEGNTNEGGSPNGDGVYNRVRNARSGIVFISLPHVVKA